MTPKTQKVIERILTKLENRELSYEFKIDCVITVINKTKIWFSKHEVTIDNIAIYIEDGALKTKIQSFLNNAANIEVENKLHLLNNILGSEDAKNLGSELFKIAKDTKSSFKEIAETAIDFSKKGLPVEPIKIINKLAQVDKQFEVSAIELGKALTLAGDSAKNASVSIYELGGVIMALERRTRLGGAVIGNGLSTIFTRLDWIGTVRDLEDVGVRSYNIISCCYEPAEREYRGALVILRDFKNKSASLIDSKRLYLEEAIAGIHHTITLRALLDVL